MVGRKSLANYITFCKSQRNSPCSLRLHEEFLCQKLYCSCSLTQSLSFFTLSSSSNHLLIRNSTSIPQWDAIHQEPNILKSLVITTLDSDDKLCKNVLSGRQAPTHRVKVRHAMPRPPSEQRSQLTKWICAKSDTRRYTPEI